MKIYYNTTKEQDSDGASPLISLEKLKNHLNKKLENIQKARDWSVDLAYPYPESHAIWIGEEQVVKKLLEELGELVE